MPTDPRIPVDYDHRRRSWRLTEEFEHTVRIEGHAYQVRMPQGTEYDLASIPRFFWRVIAPFELGDLPPLVHDWFYRGGRMRPVIGHEPLELGHPTRPTRAQADALFLDLMRQLRVPRWRLPWSLPLWDGDLSRVGRYAAYLAVRLFGWRAWADR